MLDREKLAAELLIAILSGRSSRECAYAALEAVKYADELIEELKKTEEKKETLS